MSKLIPGLETDNAGGSGNGGGTRQTVLLGEAKNKTRRQRLGNTFSKSLSEEEEMFTR